VPFGKPSTNAVDCHDKNYGFKKRKIHENQRAYQQQLTDDHEKRPETRARTGAAECQRVRTALRRQFGAPQRKIDTRFRLLDVVVVVVVIVILIFVVVVVVVVVGWRTLIVVVAKAAVAGECVVVRMMLFVELVQRSGIGMLEWRVSTRTTRSSVTFFLVNNITNETY
jgi:hypothetical protein